VAKQKISNTVGLPKGALRGERTSNAEKQKGSTTRLKKEPQPDGAMNRGRPERKACCQEKKEKKGKVQQKNRRQQKVKKGWHAQRCAGSLAQGDARFVHGKRW